MQPTFNDFIVDGCDAQLDGEVERPTVGGPSIVVATAQVVEDAVATGGLDTLHRNPAKKVSSFVIYYLFISLPRRHQALRTAS
jgi:hypothetical protein